MAKDYTERLGEWVKQSELTRRDRNVVAFLAVRNDVIAAVEAGYSVKTIWTHMRQEERITFSYDTFLNYVNRFLHSSQASSLSVNHPVAKTQKNDKIEGFTFNPIPDEKELF